MKEHKHSQWYFLAIFGLAVFWGLVLLTSKANIYLKIISIPVASFALFTIFRGFFLYIPISIDENGIIRRFPKFLKKTEKKMRWDEILAIYKLQGVNVVIIPRYRTNDKEHDEMINRELTQNKNSRMSKKYIRELSRQEKIYTIPHVRGYYELLGEIYQRSAERGAIIDKYIKTLIETKGIVKKPVMARMIFPALILFYPLGVILWCIYEKKEYLLYGISWIIVLTLLLWFAFFQQYTFLGVVISSLICGGTLSPIGFLLCPRPQPISKIYYYIGQAGLFFYFLYYTKLFIPQAIKRASYNIWYSITLFVLLAILSIIFVLLRMRCSEWGFLKDIEKFGEISKVRKRWIQKMYAVGPWIPAIIIGVFKYLI